MWSCYLIVLTSRIPSTVTAFISSAWSCTRLKLQHHLCGSTTKNIGFMRNMRSTDLAPELWAKQLPPVSHPLEQDEINGNDGLLKRGTTNKRIVFKHKVKPVLTWFWKPIISNTEHKNKPQQDDDSLNWGTQRRQRRKSICFGNGHCFNARGNSSTKDLQQPSVKIRTTTLPLSNLNAQKCVLRWQVTGGFSRERGRCWARKQEEFGNFHWTSHLAESSLVRTHGWSIFLICWPNFHIYLGKILKLILWRKKMWQVIAQAYYLWLKTRVYKGNQFKSQTAKLKCYFWITQVVILALCDQFFPLVAYHLEDLYLLNNKEVQFFAASRHLVKSPGVSCHPAKQKSHYNWK